MIAVMTQPHEPQAAKIRIYGGLSITAEQVAAILPGANFSGPIARDNLLRDIDLGYQVVGIIDGLFYQALAVTAGEIMDAIRCGLKVYGSSSMGAMRAVELEPFGMIGCGKIVELIKETPIFRDDYLGQSISTEEFGPKSVSWVDLHFELKRQIAAGKIKESDAKTLLTLYSEIHFARRNGEELKLALATLGADHTWNPRMDKLFQELKSQKHLDAIDLLQQIRQELAQTRTLNAQLWALQARSRTDQV